MVGYDEALLSVYEGLGFNLFVVGARTKLVIKYFPGFQFPVFRSHFRMSVCFFVSWSGSTRANIDNGLPWPEFFSRSSRIKGMNRNSFPLLHKKELCGRKRCRVKHEKEKTTYSIQNILWQFEIQYAKKNGYFNKSSK